MEHLSKLPAPDRVNALRYELANKGFSVFYDMDVNEELRSNAVYLTYGQARWRIIILGWSSVWIVFRTDSGVKCVLIDDIFSNKSATKQLKRYVNTLDTDFECPEEDCPYSKAKLKTHIDAAAVSHTFFFFELVESEGCSLLGCV